MVRRGRRRGGVWIFLAAWAWACAGAVAPAFGQLPESEERLKILTDPESVKRTLEKDRTRPPLELFRSQVAPFDILPFIKADHWSTLNLELRANYEDYNGLLQTAPVRLRGVPQDVVYRRDARLTKAQRSRLGQQVMIPLVPSELNLELVRPDAIRPDEVWPATLRVLEPHQMLILFLTKGPNDGYALWNRYQALYPLTLDRADVQAADRQRYYRLVLPLEPEKPPVSPHPLTWSTTSHVVWDGMPPDNLNPQQQQALLDWLHWGGQLTAVGGAGPAFSLLNDSFLAPYLPADPTGEGALLDRDGLLPLSQAYPPPVVSASRNDADDPGPAAFSATPRERLGDRYYKAVALNPPADRPVVLSGLRARPGATAIPLGANHDRVLGVEWRVGRGRVLMLGLNPTDPTLAAWPGLDTLVRRVVLRRPEDGRGADLAAVPTSLRSRPFGIEPLRGADLSWVRYLSRDLRSNDPAAEVPPPPGPVPEPNARTGPPPTASNADAEDSTAGSGVMRGGGGAAPGPPGVASWRDDAALPRISRAALDQASGIKAPAARFVLTVVVAYVLALVPLNWLVCRYLLRRPELAWVGVPVLAIGCALAIERVAAYDVGYQSACDEVDVLECFGSYPRAHVSRFASLYSTGRTRFNVTYPDDPTALALPLDSGRSLRGEDIVTSVWRSFPVPSLEGFLVQPRSLGMFRAEQLSSLDGTITLVAVGGERWVANAGTIELRDAVLVDDSGPDGPVETPLGTIPPNRTVPVPATSEARPVVGSPATAADPLDPLRFLAAFRAHHEDRPENRGEIRLVAWSPKPLDGQRFDPPVDRHRGFTAVVVHLASGPPPAPDGPTYNTLAEPPAPFPGPSQAAAKAATPPATGLPGAPRRQGGRGPRR